MLITRRFQASHKSFAHIKYLLESYDNLAIMTILDGSAGLFDLKCDDSMTRELAEVIKGISQEIDLEEL